MQELSPNTTAKANANILGFVSFFGLTGLLFLSYSRLGRDSPGRSFSGLPQWVLHIQAGCHSHCSTNSTKSYHTLVSHTHNTDPLSGYQLILKHCNVKQLTNQMFLFERWKPF